MRADDRCVSFYSIFFTVCKRYLITHNGTEGSGTGRYGTVFSDSTDIAFGYGIRMGTDGLGTVGMEWKGMEGIFSGKHYLTQFAWHNKTCAA